MMECEVKIASPAHAGVMAHIHQATFDKGWSEKDLAAMLQNPVSAGFIAVAADGQPLGMMLTSFIDGTLEIITIATLAQHRRCGVAKAMLAEAIAQTDAYEVILEVAAENSAARQFYNQYGFSKNGIRKDYYHGLDGHKDDALLLKLEVAR